jgi:hypothetical protein
MTSIHALAIGGDGVASRSGRAFGLTDGDNGASCTLGQALFGAFGLLIVTCVTRSVVPSR